MRPPSLLEVLAARPQEMFLVLLVPLLLSFAAFSVIMVAVFCDPTEGADVVRAAREWRMFP